MYIFMQNTNRMVTTIWQNFLRVDRNKHLSGDSEALSFKLASLEFHAFLILYCSRRILKSMIRFWYKCFWENFFSHPAINWRSFKLCHSLMRTWFLVIISKVDFCRPNLPRIMALHVWIPTVGSQLEAMYLKVQRPTMAQQVPDGTS